MIILVALFISFACPVYAGGQLGETKGMFELISVDDYMKYSRLKVSACATPKPPYVGVRFQYWEPSLFMETVKAPGDYVIRETGALLQGTLKGISKGKTSTSSYQSLNGSNLQFNEAHLYDVPLKLFQESVMCAGTFGDNTLLRYLSELDQEGWRKRQMGFLIHYSNLAASLTTCVRAVNLIGGRSLAVVPDQFQLVYPYKTGLFPVGTSVSRWTLSKDGRYVWIFWRYRDCCRTVSG